MTTSSDHVEKLLESEYAAGFVTAIEEDRVPPGLDESVIRHISEKKGEPAWLLDWRLSAFARWKKLGHEEPLWANVRYPKIDYQAISYYSAPKSKKDGPKSLEDVDPELLKTYDKLG